MGRRAMRGGKREGAGRKEAPPSKIIRLRFQLPDFERIKALGGDTWLKAVINEALDKLKGK